MRGTDLQQGAMFSYLSPEARVPQDHPLRPIRVMVDMVLKRLSPSFDAIYSVEGRPSIAPEKLLRALLLQALYTVRSERMLMEQMDYNLLFRWFVGLNMDELVWNPSTFSKNRDRLLNGRIAEQFFAEVLALAEMQGFLSDEHFTVDGTLIEAWAGHKSFKPKDTPPDASSDDDDPGNPTVNFRGEKRSNATHQSTTDPDARLYKKGNTASKLTFMGHVLMENRNGLVVDAMVTTATGTAEQDAALAMAACLESSQRVTLGADKGYDAEEFVDACRRLNVTPHVAQNNANRKSAIDGRTTAHPGYAISQRLRKRVEEVYGWMKTVGGLRKTRHRGLKRVNWVFTFTAAAYNLVRMRGLMAAA